MKRDIKRNLERGRLTPLAILCRPYRAKHGVAPCRSYTAGVGRRTGTKPEARRNRKPIHEPRPAPVPRGLRLRLLPGGGFGPPPRPPPPPRRPRLAASGPGAAGPRRKSPRQRQGQGGRDLRTFTPPGG